MVDHRQSDGCRCFSSADRCGLCTQHRTAQKWNWRRSNPNHLAGWLQQLQQERANKQEKLEKEIAEANQREEALQTYFDRISTLLVEKKLLAIADKLNETRNKLLLADQKLLADQELLDVSTHVIRARTLSILRRLENDGVRKTSVIQFLIEAEVISDLTRLTTGRHRPRYSISHQAKQAVSIKLQWQLGMFSICPFSPGSV